MALVLVLADVASGRQSQPYRPQWTSRPRLPSLGPKEVVIVRGQALNEAYGLPEREPGWLRASRIRSEGLNRLHRLD